MWRIFLKMDDMIINLREMFSYIYIRAPNPIRTEINNSEWSRNRKNYFRQQFVNCASLSPLTIIYGYFLCLCCGRWIISTSVKLIFPPFISIRIT